jgi:hypothetical protein
MLGSICFSFELNVARKSPALAGSGRGPGSVADTEGGRATLVREEAVPAVLLALAVFGK